MAAVKPGPIRPVMLLIRLYFLQGGTPILECLCAVAVLFLLCKLSTRTHRCRAVLPSGDDEWLYWHKNINSKLEINALFI